MLKTTFGTMDKQLTETLNPYNISTAIEDARKEIENERSDVPAGIRSRWQVINNAILKYWRFRMIYTIGGASGSGKSYLVNQLRYDFIDNETLEVDVRNISADTIAKILLNGEFIEGQPGWLIRPGLNNTSPYKIVNLHFGFEMHPMQEVLRIVSTLTGYSYQSILSSKGIKIDNSDDVFYVKVTEDEMKFFDRVLQALKHKLRNMIVFKSAGNRKELYRTVEAAYNRYVAKDPTTRLVVSMDHSLLTKKYDEKSDLELQNELIKVLIEIRDDFNAMVIPIIQTNNNMDDANRRSTPSMHYPVKSDLYMGGQFFQGSDFLTVMLQPGTMGIAEYGPYKIPTKNLIHFSLIKSRYNLPGQLWLWNDLGRGKIQSCVIDRNTSTPLIIPNLVQPSFV